MTKRQGASPDFGVEIVWEFRDSTGVYKIEAYDYKNVTTVSLKNSYSGAWFEPFVVYIMMEMLMGVLAGILVAPRDPTSQAAGMCHA